MQWGKCDTLKSVSSVQHRMQVNVKPCFSIIFAVMLSKTKNEVKAVFLSIYSRLSSSFFLKMLQKTKIYKTDLKKKQSDVSLLNFQRTNDHARPSICISSTLKMHSSERLLTSNYCWKGFFKILYHRLSVQVKV